MSARKDTKLDRWDFGFIITILVYVIFASTNFIVPWYNHDANIFVICGFAATALILLELSYFKHEVKKVNYGAVGFYTALASTMLYFFMGSIV